MSATSRTVIWVVPLSAKVRKVAPASGLAMSMCPGTGAPFTKQETRWPSWLTVHVTVPAGTCALARALTGVPL